MREWREEEAAEEGDGGRPGAAAILTLGGRQHGGGQLALAISRIVRQ